MRVAGQGPGSGRAGPLVSSSLGAQHVERMLGGDMLGHISKGLVCQA